MAPLHIACRDNDLEQIHILLKEGVDVNVRDHSNDGYQPLHYACCGDHYETAEILLNAGADINGVTEIENMTPLHIASKRRASRVAQLLVSHGANIEAKNAHGVSPIQTAYTLSCENRWLLLSHGAVLDREKFIESGTTLEIRDILELALGRQRTMDRFADCIREASDSCKATARQRFLLLNCPMWKLSSECGVLDFLIFANMCYKVISHERQMRQPVLDLLAECCDVFREVENTLADIRDRDTFKEAKASLTAFQELQSEIRNTAVATAETTTQRDLMRQKCIGLINIALHNQPSHLHTDLQKRAAAALDRLRKCAPYARDKLLVDLDISGVRKLCNGANIMGRTLALELGCDIPKGERPSRYKTCLAEDEPCCYSECSCEIESDLEAPERKTCVDALNRARNILPGALLREFGFKDPDRASRQACMKECLNALRPELSNLRVSSSRLLNSFTLSNVLTAIETALSSVVKYRRLRAEMDSAYDELMEQSSLLRAGLVYPDIDLVQRHFNENKENDNERRRWDARIVLADNEAEESVLRERLRVWEREVHSQEKKGRHQLSSWLQFADLHYPELLRHPSVTAQFTSEFEMKCAEQGLLRSGDTLGNYQIVKLLSDKRGRPVRLVTDVDGNQLVIKSYSLTTPTHFSHFLRTCCKLGALRGVVNIVNVKGVIIEEHWGHVLMHNYDGGDLSNWIREHPHRDPKLCLRIAHQILSAVKDLHSRDIVHVDLKPENILLTSTLEAVLGDFDDVRDANSTITIGVGVTRRYEAPELRAGSVDRFDKSADVYSLGLILAELFNGVDLSDTYKSVNNEDLAATCAEKRAEHPAHRPTLAQVLLLPLFCEVRSTRLCAICCEAYQVGKGLSCRNGHVTCNDCLDDWLRFDLSNTQNTTRNSGRLPCTMKDHGCEKVWDPKVYAAHVDRALFDETMCALNRPKVREQLLLEQQREAAQDKEFNYIANEILTLKCPARGHVLDESFDGCFALTCSACPDDDNEFCAFCWKGFGQATHRHVVECRENPNPGEIYNNLDVFYKLRRAERLRLLKQYWGKLDLDDEAKMQLAARVQPLLNQSKPEGTYPSLMAIVT